MDVNDLWVKWQKESSEVARNSLVEYYQPWLKKVSGYVYKSISGLGLEFSDCLNTANLGLIESIERYEPTQKASFETYASYRVKGAIYNSVSFYAPEINKFLFYRSKEDQKISADVVACSKGLEGALENNIEEMLLGELLGSMPTLVEDYDQALYLNDSDFLLIRKLNSELDNIPAEYAMVIRFHYFHSFPLKNIASMIGISTARVSQIHKQAIRQLAVQLA